MLVESERRAVVPSIYAISQIIFGRRQRVVLEKGEKKDERVVDENLMNR